jgi:hypothetical protein
MIRTHLPAESTTTCEAGGLDFRPSAEKTKKDGSTFCVVRATGCEAPGFLARIKRDFASISEQWSKNYGKKYRPLPALRKCALY